MRLETSRGTAALVVLTILGVVASALVTLGGLVASERAQANPSPATLPPGCSRPAGGFLVIVSEYGYNDSILEGAGPTKAWPVITVSLGTSVSITVCNADKDQYHGFQIANYFDSRLVSVAPGQVLQVSFVANRPGVFQIYCAIFDTIHPFLQYGQLRVVS